VKKVWETESKQAIQEKKALLTKLESDLPMLEDKVSALEKEKNRLITELDELKKKVGEEYEPSS